MTAPVQSRFDRSRYAVQLAPAQLRVTIRAAQPGVLGTFARIGFTNGTWREAQYKSWLGVNVSGRLEIKGEDFGSELIRAFVRVVMGGAVVDDSRAVAWIMYEAIDDRFGAGKRGERVFHVFGTPPRLVKRESDLWELEGGSYTVGPEGIRN